MSNIVKRTTKSWELDNIQIGHNIVDYSSLGINTTSNNSEFVRLHFGLQGAYDFHFSQLDSTYSLSGHHNNILYSNGLDLEVKNKSKRIETFGINFNPATFVGIAMNGNESLKRLADKVINKENAILSPDWKTNNFKIQTVINEIINCPYTEDLKDLFLLAKSIELLVLQAELYQNNREAFTIDLKDKNKLIEAKEILKSCLHNPPTISELSNMVALNEYKLKRGFKTLFKTTLFGYIHQSRMYLAKQLLLETNKTAKEIAYDIGYGSPQHFSKAFKKEFGIPPNSIRNNPNYTMK